ncbi:SLMAP protein, partial [Oceanites oceanicus]|nr:SLMAP protein [Oceanites oceanicus]
QFYLQDTKSSNGTFINSQRLSRGSEESPPCEIMSGDIIQFGVDVTENTRKVTHGCIVSTIKLFLPDGMEARLRSDVIHAPLPSPVDKVAANTPSMYSQELFQLSQYLQEALHREQMLEQKLATLQRLLAVTQEASDTSWQALIDEDRLLSRLEVMGNQLQACSKNQTEDSIRKELIALQEDKHNYETTAKESLRRVLQEKIEVVRKLSEVECSLGRPETVVAFVLDKYWTLNLGSLSPGSAPQTEDFSFQIKMLNFCSELITDDGEHTQKDQNWDLLPSFEGGESLKLIIMKSSKEKDVAFNQVGLCNVHSVQKDSWVLIDWRCWQALVFLSLLEHFLSKSGGDCTFIHQFIECQNKIIDEGHLTKVEETKLLKENQARVKESDLSDTLSPSKEKSSDDTTDAQMDDQDLNEPIAKVALLKDELQGAQSETEAKQEIQQLHKELIEAQELARTSKQKCFELQALLEEERKAYRVQVEESNKQINVLQAQLRRLQEDIENLREEKENEISSTRNELVSAQNEILSLQQVAEKTASERDTDISALQDELRTVRAELERWRKDASAYEKEIVSLQASFQLRCQQCEDQQKEEATRLKGELEKLKAKWSALDAECVTLRKENTLLTSELQRQEKELSSSQKQSLALTSDISVLEMSRKELENQMGSLREKHQRDAASLKSQLSEAESQAKDVQKEYERTQTVLSELKAKYEMAEQENQSLTEELKQCKENLKLLQEKGNNRQWPWMPVMAALVAVTAVVLYPGLTRASP